MIAIIARLYSHILPIWDRNIAANAPMEEKNIISALAANKKGVGTMKFIVKWIMMSVCVGVFSLSLLFGSQLRGESPSWKQQKKKYLQASRNEHNHKIKAWKEVARWSFDDNKIPKDFRVFSGKWKVVDGKLRSVGGEPDGNRRIKIANCLWPIFRLEFDVVLKPRKGAPSDRIGDVGVSVNADPETGSFGEGYSFITAQYFDQATVLYRLNIPFARTEYSPIKPGQKHHVVLEVVKPHLRFLIDGRIVLEGWERKGGLKNRRDFSDFLDMDPKKIITIHTYDSVMDIDNLRILVPEKQK